MYPQLLSEIKTQTALEKWVPTIAAGGLAAIIAEAVTLPLDTVRVRMMVLPKIWNKGYYHCLSTIYRKEGMSALMSGLNAAILRQSIFATIRLGIYDCFSQSLQENKGENEKITVFERIVMGALSVTVAITFANPSDTIKTRMQADAQGKKATPRYNSLWDATKKISKSEGIHGFYQSLPVNILRNSLSNAAELASYDQLKTFMLSKDYSDDVFLHIACGSFSGLMAATIMSPVEVIKTRIQAGFTLKTGEHKNYKNSWAVTVKTYK